MVTILFESGLEILYLSWTLPWLQRFLTLHTNAYDSMSIFLVGGNERVQFMVSVDESLINFVIQRE